MSFAQALGIGRGVTAVIGSGGKSSLLDTLILRACDQALGFPLLDSTTGGRNGGGAVLTEDGAAILEDYERFCRELKKQGDELFTQCFGHWLD